MSLTERVHKMLGKERETEKDFRYLVSVALLAYAEYHGWKSTRQAQAHYGGNREEFYADMGLWEAKTGGPPECYDDIP